MAIVKTYNPSYEQRMDEQKIVRERYGFFRQKKEYREDPTCFNCGRIVIGAAICIDGKIYHNECAFKKN